MVHTPEGEVVRRDGHAKTGGSGSECSALWGTAGAGGRLASKFRGGPPLPPSCIPFQGANAPYSKGVG
jgi:hypothetical protein